MNEISSSKLTQAVVGIIVAVMILGIVLVPVLSQATETEKTFTNTGYYRMTEITAETDGEWAYTWTDSEPNIIYVNDEAYNMDVPSGLSYSIIGASDGWVSRYINTANPYIQTMYSNGVGSGGVGLKSFECTISGGTAEFSLILSDDSTATKTIAYTTCYVLDKNGSWMMKNKDESAYMLKDSEYFAIGVTASTGFPLNVFKIEGTIDDGATVTNTIHGSGAQTFTASNVVVVSSEVSGYNDLYSLDRITFTATNGTDTINATYSYFLVPYEVTAELSDHPTPMMITLINVIPVFVVLAIILGVCGLFYYNRNENSLI